MKTNQGNYVIKLLNVTNKKELLHRLEWTLRITIALCFIGHGFWGTVSKPGWIDLITPLGFGPEFALASLPWIGWLDILLGVFVLAKNNMAWIWKAMLWTVFTAFLRPIAGMSFFEVPERAGNWGLPLAFIFLAYGLGAGKSFFKDVKLSKDDLSCNLNDDLINKIKVTLQVSVGLLLIGHGGLVAITQKAMYVNHLAVLGIEANSAVLQIYGYFEIIMGIIVLFKPNIKFLWFIMGWKLVTESLYPFAGKFVDIFETIERWGDFGGPLALILVMTYMTNVKSGSNSHETNEQIDKAA